MNKLFFAFNLLFCLALNLYSFAQDEGPKSVGLTRFNIYSIDLPGRIEDVVPLDLNQDGMTDLLITHFVRESGNHASARLISVIFHRPDTGLSSKSQQSWTIPTEATGLICGDFIKEKQGIEIGYLAPDGVYVYLLENPSAYSLNPKKLINVQPLFNSADENALPILHLPTDIDNNGTDDLIIPEQDGYTIYFYSVVTNSSFTPLKIEIPFRKIVRKENTHWLTISNILAPLRVVDVNNDGLKDLVSFQESHLIYYIQRKPLKFIVMSFELKYLKETLNNKEINAAFITFGDINQDGLIDFVISALGGNLESLSKLVTRCFIYLARRNDQQADGFSYPDIPNQIINLKGLSPLMDLGDINNDGKLDLLLASFQTDFGSNLKKALLRYIRVNYQLHLFQSKSEQFSVSPDYTQTANLPFELVGKGQKYFSHFYLKYDCNNDGRSDLLTICGPDKKRGILSIRPGRMADELINKNGVGFKKDEYLLSPLNIPNRLIVHDLNNDKRPDLILQYKSDLRVMISK